MRRLYISYLTATVFLLPSCFVPQKIVKIQAGDPGQITWNYGREVLEIKDPDYVVSVNFEDYTKLHEI